MPFSGSHSRFPHLFQPLTIRGVTLPNRIAISGHFAGWWVGEKGLPNDEFVAYVEERARGGVGLFVIGATSPMPGSGWMENTSDEIIPRYRKIAEAGRRHGTPIFAQLCHPGFGPLPGPPTYKWIPSTEAPVRPTEKTRRAPGRHIPSVDELHELVAAFGTAAGRAAAGSVDGVELHSHESFLHAQMLNPVWNERTDDYGGPLENRLRFLLETLRVMRAAIPETMPLGVRLKADDMEQRGMGPEEYRIVLNRLEAEKLVDYVIFTGGDTRLHHGPTPRPEGEWIGLVRSLRAGTSLRIMHAGRINTPEMAEEAVASGAMDVVVMTKTHIADPHFVRKVWENRPEDIRYCTRCLRCHGKMNTMTCIYNPLTSRELTWSELKLAAVRRRVVIVDGGPAGMEAALTAATRGHEVIVLEKSDRVGGQIWVAAGSPLRLPMARVAEFYTRQANKGLFEVRLNSAATAEAVLALKPDVCVVATGSRPIRASIPGPSAEREAAGKHVYTVHEVIAGGMDGARHAVVYDTEGGARAWVAADYLSARKIAVDFVTPLGRVTPGIEMMVTDEFVDRLSERGVEFWPGCTIESWDADGVVRLAAPGGAEKVISGVDAIAGMVGSESVNELSEALLGRVPELHVIGDALAPNTCEEATVAGATLGRAV